MAARPTGPTHPSIQAEIRLAERSTRRWLIGGLLFSGAVIWCLVELDEVVGLVQQLIRIYIARML